MTSSDVDVGVKWMMPSSAVMRAPWKFYIPSESDLISACSTCGFGLIRLWSLPESENVPWLWRIITCLRSQNASERTHTLLCPTTSHLHLTGCILCSCVFCFCFCFFVPSDLPRIPSRRSSSGSSAWRETSSGQVPERPPEALVKGGDVVLGENKVTAWRGWCDAAATAASHLIVSVCGGEVHSITPSLIRLTSVASWQN